MTGAHISLPKSHWTKIPESFRLVGIAEALANKSARFVVVRPWSSIPIRHFAVELEPSSGLNRGLGSAVALASSTPGVTAGETTPSSQRRFIVAWHEVVPPSFPLDPIEPLLNLRRAAHLLGISVKTLRDWIQARRIEHIKVGSRVMIRPETIRQYVTSHTRRADIR